MKIADRFASNLRRLRKAGGLTQEELAERAGVHRTEIGLLEHGKRRPGLEMLVKLAGSLDVPPGDLIEGIAWEPGVGSPGGLRITEPEARQAVDSSPGRRPRIRSATVTASAARRSNPGAESV
jgi:transcriptional regulator with XRE-family HTH domain